MNHVYLFCVRPSWCPSAIRESRGMVLLLTPAANVSLDVLQEVQRAHDERKRIVALVVRSTEPSDDLSFFLASAPETRMDRSRGDG